MNKAPSVSAGRKSTQDAKNLKVSTAETQRGDQLSSRSQRPFVEREGRSWGVELRLCFDAIGQVAGIARHAGEAARTPGIEPRQAEEVDAGHGGDAARVTRITPAIED